MKVITKVKGVNDFGKEKVGGNVYEYSHHFPRVINGDIILYYYPTDNAIGIYQAKEELEYYYKDGFQYCRGRMCRYDKSAEEFVDLMRSKNLKFGNDLENIICDLIKKHTGVEL